MMNTLKRWYRSWTINYATLLTIVGVIQANLEMLQLTPKQMGVGMMALGVATALLRAKTKTPLEQR